MHRIHRILSTLKAHNTLANHQTRGRPLWPPCLFGCLRMSYADIIICYAGCWVVME
jgi:hypothetical protein